MRPFHPASVFLFLLPSAGFAHDPGLSIAHVGIVAGAIELHVTFAPADADILIASTGEVAPADFDTRSVLLRNLAPRLVGMTCNALPIEPAAIASAWIPDTHAVELVLTFAPPEASVGGRWEYRADALALLPPGHRQLAAFGKDENAALVDALLDATHPVFPFTPVFDHSGSEVHVSSTEPTTTRRLAPFFKLGTEHILTGYDHLVFLLGLVVVCTRLRPMLLVVSCFTVAHSITLGLVAAGVVRIPGALVELMIAASIVFIGIENLATRGPSRARPWITFAFGLVHGCGFASILQETLAATPGASILVPLLGFNLGVEAGQLAVAAVAMLLLAALRRHHVFTRALVPVTSAGVALAGGGWLVLRLGGF